jgi:K+-sensing histidine kinase KdpD
MELNDNGLGIDLKKHGENIFGIYQTFHDNNNSKGVGLYITKAQVVAMGGNIEVESTPDAGTTFLITFN